MILREITIRVLTGKFGRVMAINVCFQNGGHRHIEFTSGVDFCHISIFRSPLCMFLQNFINVSRPQFEKTCEAKQKNVKSHVSWIFKKRKNVKKRKSYNMYFRPIQACTFRPKTTLNHILSSCTQLLRPLYYIHYMQGSTILYNIVCFMKT